MRRRRARWAALVAILAAGSATMWRAREPAPVPSAVPSTPAAASSTSAQPREAARAHVESKPFESPAANAAAPEPLPPFDAPLASVRDALEERARRGDTRAACRLALDASFCRINRLDDDSIAFFERDIARRPRTTPRDIAWIERLERVHERAVRVCTGLPDGWAEANAWRYLLQGAQAGDALLAAMYAVAPPLDAGAFLENPEPWTAYRQNAAALLQRAAAQGEIHAIWMLQRIHSGSHHLTGLPTAIAPDPRLAAVYAVALVPATSGDSRREFERAVTAARERYDADEWTAIEREGQALARESFAHEPPRDFQTGVFGDIDSRRCE